MLAAGFDVPYVRAQVGHTDPTMTLAIYAHVIERPDRDRLRSDMRELSVSVRRRPLRRQSNAKRQKKAATATDEPQPRPLPK